MKNSVVLRKVTTQFLIVYNPIFSRAEIAFINENFVVSYLIQFLRGDHKGVVIKKEDRAEYDEFVENLKYVLRYRMVTAQTLETMLESYIAGQVFERSIGINE